MQYSHVESKIEGIITPNLLQAGYSLVRIKHSQGEENHVQIMVEHANGTGITIDECARISRQISTLLDVEDPIDGGYLLEVSSPGLERPLMKPEDFVKYAGRTTKIITSVPIEGRKKFKGILKGVIDNNINIQTSNEDGEDRDYQIPFENISSANLMVTDDILREILNKKQ